MSINKYKAVTDFTWNDETRPEVQIHDNTAILEVGGKHTLLEIKANRKDELKEMLNGYAEIFEAAADMLDE